MVHLWPPSSRWLNLATREAGLTCPDLAWPALGLNPSPEEQTAMWTEPQFSCVYQERVSGVSFGTAAFSRSTSFVTTLGVINAFIAFTLIRHLKYYVLMSVGRKWLCSNNFLWVSESGKACNQSPVGTKLTRREQQAQSERPPGLSPGIWGGSDGWLCCQLSDSPLTHVPPSSVIGVERATKQGRERPGIWG